ncbi:MAG: Sulfate transporter/antisigma-factor antagonist [Marmoricola sp.]|jgi:anti-anti-sigma factor|nr:Sulfate transporter/antisigma-factor antagonist [Marmoricola sp.]
MDLTIDGPTLVVAGQIDVRCVTELRDALYDHLETHPEDVFLDVSDVESVDLTVLRMIAVASRLAAREDHHLTLRGCPPAVRRLLHLTHLRNLVEVESGAATA